MFHFANKGKVAFFLHRAPSITNGHYRRFVPPARSFLGKSLVIPVFQRSL
jgi:hypothetical protein